MVKVGTKFLGFYVMSFGESFDSELKEIIFLIKDRLRKI